MFPRRKRAPPASEPAMAENQAPRQTSWKSCPAWNQDPEFSSPGTDAAAAGRTGLRAARAILGARKLPGTCVLGGLGATKRGPFAGAAQLSGGRPTSSVLPSSRGSGRCGWLPDPHPHPRALSSARTPGLWRVVRGPGSSRAGAHMTGLRPCSCRAAGQGSSDLPEQRTVIFLCKSNCA